jgi:hypothetical protein
MITKELLSYIETQTSRGVEKDLIKKALIEAGWKELDVNEAFESLTTPSQVSLKDMTQTQVEGVKVMPTVSRNNSSGIFKTFFIILLVFAMLSFAGAFVYVSYFKDPSPQEVLKGMISTLTGVNTFEYNLNVKTNGSTCANFDNRDDIFKTCTSKKDFINITSVLGIADITNFNNPTHRVTFITENRLQGEGGVLEKTSAQLDVISLNKKLYTKLSNLVFTQQSFFDTSSFINKWINIDISQVQKEFIGTDPSMNSELITREKTDRLKETFFSTNVFSVIHTSKEIFEGKNVYKFSFEITPEQQKQFLIEMYSILFDDLNGQDGQMTQENINAISDATQGLSTIQGDLWIGKDDLLPYKIVLSPSLSVSKDVFEVSNLSMELVIRNYNIPVSVQAPASTMTFEQVMTELFSTPKQATTTPAKQIAPKR